MSALVTLTTDFEEQDPFVASMKGVLATRCPGAQVMDLSHQIPRNNVFEGALFIAGALPYFPQGTVHIVAIASGPLPIVVSLQGQLIVCPNNGVTTLLAEHYGIDESRSIANPDLHMSEGDQTFFGRDVFAPAAAFLAGGSPLAEVGDPVDDVKRLDIPKPQKESERLVSGRIMHVDRFGNLVTNIHRSFLEGSSVTNVEAGRLPMIQHAQSYKEVAVGSPVAIYGSAGYLEIAYNGDRAQSRLDVGIGNIVKVSIAAK